MKYSQIFIIRTSIIRGFSDQNLVRLSTADNKGRTVQHTLSIVQCPYYITCRVQLMLYFILDL